MVWSRIAIVDWSSSTRSEANPARLAALLLKITHVGLPSLVLGREVQPEFLQHHCTAENLAPAVARLLADPAAREHQIADYREVLARLKAGEAPPSRLAARHVLDAFERSRLQA